MKFLVEKHVVLFFRPLFWVSSFSILHHLCDLLLADLVNAYPCSLESGGGGRDSYKALLIYFSPSFSGRCHYL